jgi:hypothetical protein
MVCKIKSREKKANIIRKGKGPWSALVAEAEGKVKEAKRRVAELELAAETFRRYEREGAPWPLTESSTQN